MKRKSSRTTPVIRESALDAYRFKFLIAGSVKCAPQSGLGLQRWQSHRLVVVRGGSGELLLQGRTISVRRGHVIFGLPGEEYDLRVQLHKQLVISIVRFRVYNSAGKQITLPPEFRPSLCTDVKSFLLLEELMLRFTNSVPKVPCWVSGFSAVLFRFILWLIREDRHTGENHQTRNIVLESLRPAIALTHQSLNREPRTAELARLCGMSTSTFVRRMHAGYGLSPKQFVIRQRIERAKVLLLESPYTIEAIAAELGYKEPGHFTWQFKKWVGVSPSAFRTSDH